MYALGHDEETKDRIKPPGASFGFPDTLEPLDPSLVLAETTVVAQRLLGKLLVHETPEGRCAGVIVETEAYLSADDPGCHAARGRTPRNEAMWGPPGRAYVYQIYGMHVCLNLVTAPEGVPEAVLIRALEPVEGIELMQRRRRTNDIRALCSGPAKLCQALGITLQQYGADMLRRPLYVAEAADAEPRLAPRQPAALSVVTTTRVGLPRGKGDDLLLRYYIRDSQFVSRR